MEKLYYCNNRKCKRYHGCKTFETEMFEPTEPIVVPVVFKRGSKITVSNTLVDHADGSFLICASEEQFEPETKEEQYEKSLEERALMEFEDPLDALGG